MELSKEQVLELFPIGSKVKPLNFNEAKTLGVDIDSIGIVKKNDGEFLDVMWPNGTRCEDGDGWFAERFRPVDSNVDQKEPIKNLKELNTDGRDSCAGCGTKLRDPGMGAKYRYCKICEP